MADASPRGEMPFLDHLEELRWRLLKSLLAIALGSAAGWFVVQRFDIIGILKRPIAPLLPDGRLVFTSPAEPLMITVKFAFVVGLLLASPVVIYQVWAFLAPALYEREKRLIVPALSVGVVLFLIGAAACYLWVLPAALEVLFAFQRNDLAPFITVDRYFSFAAQLIIAFGVVTELPLVVAILAALGLVTPQFLTRHRRYAIVISALVAAFLTPPDALSMLMMLVPLLLLYELSIFCAWVAVRRRARRAAAARTAGLALLLCCAAAGPTAPLAAQQPPPRPQRPLAPPQVRRDTLPPGAAPTGRTIDTASARKVGLPAGPTRSFPPSDAIMDSLLKRTGFRITRYVADTLVVEGDSQTILLRGAAFVDRDGTQLEADSVRYHEASCRLDATGDPRLFDQGTVLVGEGMRYDTCIRRGTVRDALTDFDQGGSIWYMRGDLAVDSGSTRLYGAASDVTTCDLPVPHYQFAARQMKWLNKNVMVARPAVLYIRDVPILWLPFIFQDIRRGRRSGLLVPRFGLNDLVRPSRGYQRHVANLGYYFALSDYVDLLVSADWYAGRYYSLQAQTQYRWLDRFITGGLRYSRLSQLDADGTSSSITWNHAQSFDSRTSLNASINYATSGQVVQRNTVNPFLATAQLTSNANFSKRFGWGAFNLGGSRSQNLVNEQVSQNFPQVTLTPSPINLASWITWSPQFSLTNNQTFRTAGPVLLVPGDSGLDSLATSFDNRTTSLTFQTPLRLGRWNLSNGVTVLDQTSSQRREFFIPDSTVPGGVRRVLYGATFETRVDWQTGFSLPQLFSGTWKLQPGISIQNTTTAGPFMIRNQFSGGEFIRQGKRLAFSAGIRPSLFGFFPGVGPVERIRHTLSPIVDYQYAPGARVPEEYARALDPTGRTLNAKSDPQQTISFGLSQNFEGKLRPAAGDTTEREARKVRLLSISTSPVSYNFEQAKKPGLTGWQTQTLSNTFASDLLRGFSLQTTHDLWLGQAGTDTAKFDPFLTSITASFSVSPATLRSIAGLVGLGGGEGGGGGDRAVPPTPGPAQDSVPGPLQQPGLPLTRMGGGAGGPLFPGDPRAAGAFGRGFSLNVSYSNTRTRPVAATPGSSPISGPRLGGQHQLLANLSFSPTALWQATWSTTYDFDTRQFGQHVVRFERDLHDWRASFSFVKSATGSFAFSFYVALIPMPDIKFDYDQQSFPRQ
ncbi:MAG: twin-arginine translocase subunit TatC [Gemmatimonadales bacterium]